MSKRALKIAKFYLKRKGDRLEPYLMPEARGEEIVLALIQKKDFTDAI